MIDDIIHFIISTNLGDISSVFGVIITIVGFVFTLINVLRSKNAAIEAQRLTSKVREDIYKFDIISSIASAISTMEEIRRLHRQSAWEILPDRYSSIKRSLITIKKSEVELSKDHEKSIQGAITNFSSIEKQIESALFLKKAPDNIDKLNSLISKQIDILQEIFEEIRNRIGN